MVRPVGGASACPDSKGIHGQDRSQSCDHARLHRMPAAQLPDDEIEAERSGSRRVQQVLPLVRSSHPAPGDALVARAADIGRGRSSDRPDRPTEEVQPKRGGFFGFVGESIAELRKVEWPSQNQVIQGTVVVLVACAIVGAFLWLNDQVWKYVVEKVLI